MKKIFIVLSLLCITTISYAQFWNDNLDWKEQDLWNKAREHKTPEWFRNAKFGIYFHWGVYSYMGHGEWYSRHMYDSIPKGFGADVRPYHLKTYGPNVQYHDFIPKFTAKYFDAKDWAKLFKQSGAKFAGPVAEHCDNFSNWDSKVNKYNTVNYGPKRDLVGELCKAIKGEGLKFVTTFHHSWEWGWYNLWSGRIDTSNVEFRDLYGEYTPKETFSSFSAKGKHIAGGQFYGEVKKEYAPSRKFVDTWKAKIYEVINQYHPDLLWFDSRVFLLPEKDRAEMVNYYYDKAKMNHQDVVMTYKNLDLPVGVAVIDLEEGRMDNLTNYPWLTDDSYAWYGWGWRPDLKLKEPDDIVDELIDIVSKNGCLLLNITPTADGRIPQKQRDGLINIGKWLKVNGQAIYDTRPFIVYGEGVTKLKINSFGGVIGKNIKYTDRDFRFTVNGNNLYIIQMAAPTPGMKYTVQSLAKRNTTNGENIKDIKILGSKEKVKWEHTDKGLIITAPLKSPNDYAVVYKVSLKEHITAL